MATLDGFSPYSSGMTAKQAVQSLWNAYNINTNYSKVISSPNPPAYQDVSNDCSFWYCTSTNKLYKGVRNTDLLLIMWFEV
jgi:hypothetical protein